jgi:hypothetical protein
MIVLKQRWLPDQQVGRPGALQKPPGADAAVTNLINVVNAKDDRGVRGGERKVLTANPNGAPRCQFQNLRSVAGHSAVARALDALDRARDTGR